MDWKDEYFCYANNFRNNLHKLIEICEEQKTDKIYKFRKGDDWDIKNLKNDILKMTSAIKFNDPFDSVISVINKDTFLEEFLLLSEHPEFNEILKAKSIEELCENMHKDLYPHYEDFLKKTQICCFSSTIDSILMWSHYANEHKGFCIEYDTKMLLKRLLPLYPVKYSNKMPIWETGNDNFKRGVYTKASEWEYENEWRVIMPVDDNQLLNIKDPTSIYIGCNASETLRNDLIEICKNKKIDCYQAKKDYYDYKLNYVKII